jgi:hypothetical protein
MKKMLFTLIFCTFSLVSLAETPEKCSLFEGESLDGWTIEGGTATYEIVDDMIVGTTVEGSKNTFLCTEKDYSDFEMELDVLCDPELNSGIQIRSHVYQKPTPQMSNPNRIREEGEVYGYQCEITDSESGRSGSFWDEGRRTKWLNALPENPEARKAFREGEWNHYRIRAEGDRIQSWINGEKIADFKDDLDDSGFIGLQVHSIRQGTGPFQVRWKNIYLNDLSEKKSDK